MQSELTTEEIANLFRAADEDGSGFLSPTEIASIMTKLNGGVTPSEADVVSCLRVMDTNEDGQISEEEFLNAMRTWLGLVKSPRPTSSGKRQVDEESSPAFSRKKTLNDMANFFRQFSTVTNFAAEQNRILTSRRKEVDMTSVHREYATPSAEEKAEAYEAIKSLLANGKAPIMKEIHSLDWGVVLEGVEKVKTLLSVVEIFPSEDERFGVSTTIFPIFEGITEDGEGGSIVHRLCSLLTPDVPVAIQPTVFIPCLLALRNYIVGPCIPSVDTLQEENIWNPAVAFTKQVVEREQLPLRLMKILDDYSVVTPNNQELLVAAVKCVSTLSEEHIGCLECMLNIGSRLKIINILKQDAAGLDLYRSAFGCLAVLCGYSHSFDANEVASIPTAVGITEQELFDILSVVQSCCNKIVDTGMLDEVLVMNVALVSRYLLPLCNPEDPLYLSIVDRIMRLLQHSWAPEGSGLYTSISLDYCIVELMNSSKDICRELWHTTSIATIMFQQIQSVSAQSMADISSEICVTCLSFFELLLEYQLLDILAHHDNHGFLKQCVSLIPSSECGTHVISFLAKCMQNPALIPTLVSLGVIDGFMNIFTKFKQNVNTLSEVLGSFVGPVYNITTVKSVALTLHDLLMSDIPKNTKIFHADHIDMIEQLHTVMCEELRKGQLRFSQELIDMSDAVLQLLEAIGQGHVSTRSSLAGLMTVECGRISSKWNKDLNTAYTAGTFAANTDMETDIVGYEPPAPFHASHIFQRTDIELIGVPLWERSGARSSGGRVLNATVPRNVTVAVIRNGFSSMCQQAVSVNFENDSRNCVPLVDQRDLNVLIDRACSVRSNRRPTVTIYLKRDNTSSFSSTSMKIRQATAPVGGKKKETVLAELKRQGIMLGKKVNSELMSAFYDYFKEKDVAEINQEEFVTALTSDKLGYDELFAADIFNGFDDDGNGTLSLTEIAIGFAKLMNGSTDDKLSLMFQAYDTDRNNALDVDELTNMIMVASGMSYEESYQHAQAVGTHADDNDDGWLDFEEFKKAAYLGLIPLGISWSASDHIVPHSTSSAQTGKQIKYPTTSVGAPAVSSGHNRPDQVMQRARSFDDGCGGQAGDVPVPGLTRSSCKGVDEHIPSPVLSRTAGTGATDQALPPPHLKRGIQSADDSLVGVKSDVTATPALRRSAVREENPFGKKK